MGTSVSQRSPSTPNWRLVDKGYSREDIPIDRLAQEIWRAANNQPQGNLFQDLSAPIVAECLRIVEQASSRSNAIQQIRRTIAFSGQVSLASEIAQRAVVQAFQITENRTNGFVQSLFSEASNYLVSRDLSGFIGSGRLQNVSDVIALKDNIKRHVSQLVNNISPVPRNLSEPGVWKEFVNKVVDRVTKGEE